MKLTKTQLLNHFEIVCKDRISTLIEDSGRYVNCICDIKEESCEECSFWEDGIKNYQLHLEDIADTRSQLKPKDERIACDECGYVNSDEEWNNEPDDSDADAQWLDNAYGTNY